MPTKEYGKLRDSNNVALLNNIRTNAGLEYQRRIPEATKGNIREVLANLTKYRPLWNEFESALVNRIGSVIVRNKVWSNPLAEFKRGMLNYGDTIEDIQVGLLEAHIYDPNRDYMERTLFGRETPDVRSAFHTINRRDFYKITVNEPLLQNAFLAQDGISQFVDALMAAPATSDQWDEFLITTSLFAEYERLGGYFHVHIPEMSDLESNPDAARGALKRMRAMAERLKFLSTIYNAAHMPSFATPDELLIFATPEFVANVDVDALAGAFNIDRAAMVGRIITIPQERFGIDACQAIMTTRNFFVMADQRLENTSQWNPASLSTNYFLHHWGLYSLSLYAPAVMFWTGPDDEIVSVAAPKITLGTITLTDSEGETVTTAEIGKNVQAAVAITGADNLKVGLDWEISGAESSRTRVTNNGVLTIGYDETATSVTLTVTATFVDPADASVDIEPVTRTVTVDVTDTAGYWPGKAKSPKTSGGGDDVTP